MVKVIGIYNIYAGALKEVVVSLTPTDFWAYILNDRYHKVCCLITHDGSSNSTVRLPVTGVLVTAPVAGRLVLMEEWVFVTSPNTNALLLILTSMVACTEY